MKRKNVIFDKGNNFDVEDYVLRLAEKNDDPDIWLGLTEKDVPIDFYKNRKDESIEFDKEENSGSQDNNDQSSSSSSSSASNISNAISSAIVPAVAAVVVAGSGLVPGLEGLDGLNVLGNTQNNITASIVSFEQTNHEAQYIVNLDFETNLDELFNFNDQNVEITLTNDFVNCEQDIKYNDTGPAEQEYVVEPKGNSKIKSKYTIKPNGEEVIDEEKGSSKHSFNVKGLFEGLNENMSYTLTVKAKNKVLAKQELKTKTNEETPPFEIVGAEITTDTYKDIASFEMLINTKNWSDSINLNDENIVLKLSNGQKTVEFKISTDYNYALTQGIELIYDLSHNQVGLGNTMFTLRGDISKLSENTNYTMTLLSKDKVISEKSFETKSDLKGLKVQTEAN